MDLTDERKKHIDSLSYEQLLTRWRFAPAGDPWFSGETGSYWSMRMKELALTVDDVAISKKVGWDKNGN
jgi:hypothetical protein